MIRFINWLFRTFMPYLTGIALGVGFFFLMTHYAPSSVKVQVPAVPAAKSVAPVTPAAPVVQAAVEKPAQQTTPAPAAVVTAPVSEPPAPAVKTPAPAAPTPDVKVQAPVTPAPAVKAQTPVAPAVKAQAPVVSAPAVKAQAPVAPALAVKEQAPVVSAPAVKAQAPVAPALAVKEQAPVVSAPAVKAQAPETPVPAAGQAVSSPDMAGQTQPSTHATAETTNEEDWSPAGQWKQNCLARLEWAKRMVEEGLSRCPPMGFMQQNCIAYYRGLESRYQGVSCDPMSGNMATSGW